MRRLQSGPRAYLKRLSPGPHTVSTPSLAYGEPLALAGLWERRMHDDGPAHWSFAMLTINADNHRLICRFHKPGEEKRSVVVLDPDDYQAWLQARTAAEAWSFLRPFDPEMMVARADPRPARGRG